MCKITKTTIRYKCHDAVYTEEKPCRYHRRNLGCHEEYFEETIDEPRKLCKGCEKEKRDHRQATAEADLRIEGRALELIEKRKKDKGKSALGYLNSGGDSRSAGDLNSSNSGGGVSLEPRSDEDLNSSNNGGGTRGQSRTLPSYAPAKQLVRHNTILNSQDRDMELPKATNEYWKWSAKHGEFYHGEEPPTIYPNPLSVEPRQDQDNDAKTIIQLPTLHTEPDGTVRYYEPNSNPAIEKWMNKVSNPSTRNSAQSEEKNKDFMAWYSGSGDYYARSSDYDWSDCEAWSSGKEDLEVTPVTREVGYNPEL